MLQFFYIQKYIQKLGAGAMVEFKQLSSKLFLSSYNFSLKKINNQIVISYISDELSDLINTPVESLINRSIDLPKKYTDILDKAWNGKTEIRVVHSNKLTEILMIAIPVFKNGEITSIEGSCLPLNKIKEEIA